MLGPTQLQARHLLGAILSNGGSSSFANSIDHRRPKKNTIGEVVQSAGGGQQPLSSPSLVVPDGKEEETSGGVIPLFCLFSR
jgi:hypothetical protein